MRKIVLSVKSQFGLICESKRCFFFEASSEKIEYWVLVEVDLHGNLIVLFLDTSKKITRLIHKNK